MKTGKELLDLNLNYIYNLSLGWSLHFFIEKKNNLQSNTEKFHKNFW